jgi:hypothetical protein
MICVFVTFFFADRPPASFVGKLRKFLRFSYEQSKHSTLFRAGFAAHMTLFRAAPAHIPFAHYFFQPKSAFVHFLGAIHRASKKSEGPHQSAHPASVCQKPTLFSAYMRL